MPNYNNAEWLPKSIGSIKSQTFNDYDLVFIDDCSSDNSAEIVVEMINDGDLAIGHIEKIWNGGARNVGLNCHTDAQYTLFLDSDDWFVNKNVFRDLHDFIIGNNYPDCIRLPYLCRIGENETSVILDDATPKALVQSPFVACWTKCIKSDLIQPFPENTLMEDVVQHIAQCDKITTVEPFYRPVVVWNRNNANSITRSGSQDLKRGKWQSSMYRYMADLLDLRLTHDYCIAERDKRAKICLENIKADKYIQ
jgi:glycosyltransferase involved in cell wall biosynthesis